MKFCRDCAHYVKPEGWSAAIPGAPFCGADEGRRPVDLVTGARRMESCAVLRKAGGVCGEEAALFALKPASQKAGWLRSWLLR